MIVSIHQPAYLPWLGYFDKISRADLFIYLDTVQFQKNSFQNRNKIRTKSGSIWLTVPVVTSGILYETKLKDLRIDATQKWQSKHLAALRMNYAKAPAFEEVMPLLAPFYERPQERLSDLCWEMLAFFSKRLGIGSRMVKASDLPPVPGAKSDLVLELCQQAGATTYLSGSMGRQYLELEKFGQAGIDVRFQDYQHPTYQQVYPGFEPNLGVADLLFNEKNSNKFFSE
jgi:hypothetical protein